MSVSKKCRVLTCRHQLIASSSDSTSLPHLLILHLSDVRMGGCPGMVALFGDPGLGPATPAAAPPNIRLASLSQNATHRILLLFAAPMPSATSPAHDIDVVTKTEIHFVARLHREREVLFLQIQNTGSTPQCSADASLPFLDNDESTRRKPSVPTFLPPAISRLHMIPPSSVLDDPVVAGRSHRFSRPEIARAARLARARGQKLEGDLGNGEWGRRYGGMDCGDHTTLEII